MDWDKLKTFYHVAKSGGFTKAEDIMHISQSSISRQIQTLEDRLKVRLFKRSAGGTFLTEEGEVLFATVVKVYETLESATAVVRSLKHETRGKIRVETTNAMAAGWLPWFLKDFLNEYPEIQISIIGSDKELDLLSREADVAIRNHPSTEPGMTSEHMMTFRLGLFASKGYIEKYGAPKTLADLDNHRLLVFGDDRSSPYDEINWMLTAGKSSGTRAPYVSINSTTGLVAFANQDLGIISSSEQYVKLCENLVRVLPEVSGPEIKVYYIYPNGLASVKKIMLLGEHLKNSWANE